jgi:hypothetical protein
MVIMLIMVDLINHRPVVIDVETLPRCNDEAAEEIRKRFNVKARRLGLLNYTMGTPLRFDVEERPEPIV